MTRLRRGNYVFVRWAGDHSPRHVHVYKDGAFVVKWDLDHSVPMRGNAGMRLRQLIAKLVKEGLL